MLKKTSSFVLASFRPSTYPRGYASPLRSLRPCWTAFLSILRCQVPQFLLSSCNDVRSRNRVFQQIASETTYRPKLFFISPSSMLGNPDQSCCILVRNKLAHATAPSDRTFLVDTAGHTPVAFHHRVRNLPAHHPFHRAALFECCLCKVLAQASTTAQRIE